MAVAVPYLIYAAIIIAAAAASYYFSKQNPPKPESMKPATLDSFSVTYCEEGTVVPLIYGTCRVPGNILWYGNLVTDVEHSRGPGRTIAGYWYRLDVWQNIGHGLLEIIGIYSGDKVADVTNSYTYTPGSAPSGGITRTFTTRDPASSQTIVYNPGDSIYYPTEPGPNASAMHPTCHVFMDGWLLPKNSTYLPTVHWVVKHRWPTWFPIVYPTLDNGDNPAAIIYDILTKAGETSFNLPSFQTAATVWYGKGHGLNISFSEQLSAKELIQTIFNYVDGVLRQNAAGEWELLAYSDADAATGEAIETEDFIEFTFARDSWDSVPNYFVANYQDASADYTRRTVRLSNSALIKMLGYRRTRTVDLTAFSSATSASARLWQLTKRYSFPILRIQFKTDLRFHNVHVGDVKNITNTDYGILNADFRITSRSMEDLDKNLIAFEAEQLWSTLFDGSFEVGGAPDPPSLDYSPDPLVYQHAFNLPATTTYGSDSFLLLAARSGTEAYFNVYISYDGGVGYSFVKSATLWSLRGVLNHDYDSSHTSQSDPTAIDLKFYREDPVFESLTSEAFPYTDRFALIGNEIMRFQTVSPGTEDDDLLLTTIERGCFSTPVEDHSQDDEIWLFELGDGNVLDGISATSFHLKFVPVTGSLGADISECIAIPVSV